MTDETRLGAARGLRAATEARDHAALVRLFAPDVVLHSPIIGTALRGRDAVGALYAVLMERFTDYRYTAELAGDGAEVLLAEGTLRGVDLQTAVAVRANADGLIDDITVITRPLAGVVALLMVLGPPLAARRGRWHALLMRLLTPPLPVIAKLVDRLAPRLIDVGPRR